MIFTFPDIDQYETDPENTKLRNKLLIILLFFHSTSYPSSMVLHVVACMTQQEIFI